ncbi:MAG: hypothetical protein Q9220_001714 [cf. Caloplaca sp. 1 TL-2023]
MISQKIFDLCQSSETVSRKIAEDPKQSPGHVFKDLYHKHSVAHAGASSNEGRNPQEYDLERAYQCGQWGQSRPSDLFLKTYHDVLCCLDADPMAGMTSLPLLGSSGTVPLTIIGPLPDICRHMSNCIARAEKEVFLATNYWKASDASLLITNGLKELSDRAGKRGSKAVVKIMYDRGNVKQVR